MLPFVFEDATPVVEPPRPEYILTSKDYAHRDAADDEPTLTAFVYVLRDEEPVHLGWMKGVLVDLPTGSTTDLITYDVLSLPSRPDLGDAPQRAPKSRAYAAFKDLGRYLTLTDSQVAELVGVKRTTAYSWERETREPRPDTARRLMQFHATVMAVVDRLDEEGAQRWLATGSPTPAELLRSGRLAEVDRLVGELLFGRPADMPRPGAYIPVDEDEGELSPSDLAARLGA